MRRTIPMFALALAALFAAPVYAAPKATPLEWTLEGKTYSGYLVFDPDGDAKRPGLVMVPNWKGVNESAIEKAKQVAGNDYVVLVADVYGKGVRPRTDAEAGPVAEALRGDRPQLRKRVEKAVAVLKQQAGKAPLDASRIGAFGFCFGGTTVLELVRGGSQLAGVVTLHGGLSTTLPAAPKSVKTPLLVLNGADDRGISAQDIAALQKEMDASDADWQFVNFSGAVHCFSEYDANSPPGCVYHPRAAKRAFRMMGDFFEEVFAKHVGAPHGRDRKPS